MEDSHSMCAQGNEEDGPKQLGAVHIKIRCLGQEMEYDSNKSEVGKSNIIKTHSRGIFNLFKIHCPTGS